MFGPKHVPFILRYFDGIDAAVSRKLERMVPPDEPALTNEFCALMDADTQLREQSIPYRIDQLNSDLREVGDDIHFEFSITTRPHNARMEGYVSQSDLGFIIDYRNHLIPNLNRSWIYLLQAKRLFRNEKKGVYDTRSRFQSTDAQQHARIEKLVSLLGRQFFRYLYYCPQVEVFEEQAKIILRAQHTIALSQNIFDFVGGLALHDYLSRGSGRIDSGMWLGPIEDRPSSLLKLHNRAFAETVPLSWFFLVHFSPVSRGSFLEVLSQQPPDRSDKSKIVRCLVEGEIEPLRGLLSEDHIIDGEKGPFRILPKHTIKIGISVGASVKPDDRTIEGEGIEPERG